MGKGSGSDHGGSKRKKRSKVSSPITTDLTGRISPDTSHQGSTAPPSPNDEYMQPVTSNQTQSIQISLHHDVHILDRRPKRYERCPFFFSAYGCRFGDYCKFQHIAPPVVNVPDNSGGANSRIQFIKASIHRKIKKDDIPFPIFGQNPAWDRLITIVMDVKSSRLNRASELSLRQIGRSCCVEVCINDQNLDGGFKSVEIMGKLDRASEACEKIRKLERRDSLFFSGLREVEPGSDTIMEPAFQCYREHLRWPGLNVFRMVVPGEVDIDVCSKEFRSTSCATLKMMKRSCQNIALLYAEEQCGSRSPAVVGILSLFDSVVKCLADRNSGDRCSVKLLVEKEQAYEFFRTEAESVEEECRCALAVHDTDGIGLIRDVILEVVGEISRARIALIRVACFFQSYSIHKCMIPVMEMLMEGSLMENKLAETSVDPHASNSYSLKDVTEYRLDLYYVATALIGENGATLFKIRDDSGAIITLEEIEELPGEIMLYILDDHLIRNESGCDANAMIMDLLSKAAQRTHEHLFIPRKTYKDKIVARY